MIEDKLGKLNGIVVKHSRQVLDLYQPPFFDIDVNDVNKNLILDLKKNGFDAILINGKIILDNKTYDKDVVEHSWIMTYLYNKKIFIDITAIKYQFYMDSRIPKCLITRALPYYYER